jgi:DNA-binding NtrC family response regulator
LFGHQLGSPYVICSFAIARWTNFYSALDASDLRSDRVKILRTLVVEDDDLLSKAIARELRRWCQVVDVASNIEQACGLLEAQPGLVLVDVCLPDGSGVEVVRHAAALQPKPRIIAISARATAEEGFQLANAGACAYLPKPISLDSLSEVIERVLRAPVDLRVRVADAVGSMPFEQAHADLKLTMIRQALGLSDGNITRAADMLGVSRQRLQQWIRALDLEVGQARN